MSSRRGVLFGLLAGLLWGLDGVLLGGAESGGMLRTALLTACIHDGLAAVWLLGVNFKRKKIRQYRDCLVSRQFLAVFLCALLGGAAGMTCNILAISLAGASAACAVTSAYPVAGAVLGMVFLHEKCRLSSVCGIVFVAVGAVIIGFAQGGASGGNVYAGLAFAGAAMLCWALEGILSKSGMGEIDSDVLIGLREMISCMIYLIALLVTFPVGGLTLHGFPFIAAASLAGAFSYLCWYRSMDISGVTVGMSLNATYALWAVLLDMPINGVRFSLPIMAGAGVILLGTVLTILSEKRKQA